MWPLLAVTVSLSLVQKTVVAGPPVEVQVRVNTGGSTMGSVCNWKLIPPEIVTIPVRVKGTHEATMVIVKYHVTSIASRPLQA